MPSSSKAIDAALEEYLLCATDKPKREAVIQALVQKTAVWYELQLCERMREVGEMQENMRDQNDRVVEKLLNNSIGGGNNGGSGFAPASRTGEPADSDFIHPLQNTPFMDLLQKAQDLCEEFRNKCYGWYPDGFSNYQRPDPNFSGSREACDQFAARLLIIRASLMPEDYCGDDNADKTATANANPPADPQQEGIFSAAKRNQEIVKKLFSEKFKDHALFKEGKKNDRGKKISLLNYIGDEMLNLESEIRQMVNAAVPTQETFNQFFGPTDADRARKGGGKGGGKGGKGAPSANANADAVDLSQHSLPHSKQSLPSVEEEFKRRLSNDRLRHSDLFGVGTTPPLFVLDKIDFNNWKDAKRFQTFLEKMISGASRGAGSGWNSPRGSSSGSPSIMPGYFQLLIERNKQFWPALIWSVKAIDEDSRKERKEQKIFGNLHPFFELCTTTQLEMILKEVPSLHKDAEFLEGLLKRKFAHKFEAVSANRKAGKLKKAQARRALLIEMMDFVDNYCGGGGNSNSSDTTTGRAGAGNHKQNYAYGTILHGLQQRTVLETLHLGVILNQFDEALLLRYLELGCPRREVWAAFKKSSGGIGSSLFKGAADKKEEESRVERRIGNLRNWGTPDRSFQHSISGIFADFTTNFTLGNTSHSAYLSSMGFGSHLMGQKPVKAHFENFILEGGFLDKVRNIFFDDKIQEDDWQLVSLKKMQAQQALLRGRESKDNTITETLSLRLRNLCNTYDRMINMIHRVKETARYNTLNQIKKSEFKPQNPSPPAEFFPDGSYPIDNLEHLREKVNLELLDQNETTFVGDSDGRTPISSANQPVKLKLKIKNVEQLAVRLYVINAENWLMKHRKNFTNDIDLEGVGATEEVHFTYPASEYPPIREHVEEFDFGGGALSGGQGEKSFKSMTGKNGLFVIDFVGNGMRTRAVIQKGGLTLVQNVTPVGHVCYVLGPDGNIVKPGANTPPVRLHAFNRWWNADDGVKNPANAGRIIIPFAKRNQQSSSSMIVSAAGITQFFKDFTRKSERYELKTDFSLLQESVITGQTACVVVKPRLFCHGKVCDSRLLKKPKLRITIEKEMSNGTIVPSVRSFEGDEWFFGSGASSGVNANYEGDGGENNEVEMEDAGATGNTTENKEVHVYDPVGKFLVPSHLRLVQVDFACEVWNYNNEEFESFVGSKTFSIEHFDGDHSNFDFFLSYDSSGNSGSGTPPGYVICCLGKDGEPKSKLPVNVTLSSGNLCSTDLGLALNSLKTDQNGRIYLGELPLHITDIRVSARVTSGAGIGLDCARSWNLPDQLWSAENDTKNVLPALLDLLEGEPVVLPFLKMVGSGGVTNVAANVCLLQKTSDSSCPTRPVDVSLTKSHVEIIQQPATTAEKNNDNLSLVKIKGLPRGEYVVYLYKDGSTEHPSIVTLRVHAGETWKKDFLKLTETGRILDRSQSTLNEKNRIISFAAASRDEGKIVASVMTGNSGGNAANGAAQTLEGGLNVHVYGFRFFPSDLEKTFLIGGSSKQSSADEKAILEKHHQHDSSNKTYDMKITEAAFQSNVKLGDETNYVLRRRELEKRVGNFLPKPDLILQPREVRETTEEDETVKEGGDFQAKMMESAAANYASMASASRMAKIELHQKDVQGFQDFLQQPPLIMLNSPISGEVLKAQGGSFQIDADLSECACVLLVVEGLKHGKGNSVSSRLVPVKGASPSHFTTRPLALQQALSTNAKQVFSERRFAVGTKQGDSFTFKGGDPSSAEWRVVDSISRVLDYFQANESGESDKLEEWRWVEWGFLSMKEKGESWSKHACHEFHVFLKFKDPDFFATVVRPVLENSKMEKTFVDLCLLQMADEGYGAPAVDYSSTLLPFLAPANFWHLNAIEKVLLIRAVASYFGTTSDNNRALKRQQLLQILPRLKALARAVVAATPSADEKLRNRLLDSVLSFEPEEGGGGGGGDEILRSAGATFGAPPPPAPGAGARSLFGGGAKGGKGGGGKGKGASKGGGPPGARGGMSRSMDRDGGSMPGLFGGGGGGMMLGAPMAMSVQSMGQGMSFGVGETMQMLKSAPRMMKSKRMKRSADSAERSRAMSDSDDDFDCDDLEEEGGKKSKAAGWGGDGSSGEDCAELDEDGFDCEEGAFDDDFDADDIASIQAAREPAAWAKPEETKEYAETQWSQTSTNFNSFSGNQFWAEAVLHAVGEVVRRAREMEFGGKNEGNNAKTPFLSSAFIYANSSLAEKACAIALLDLPFEAGDHSLDPTSLRVASNCIVVAKEICEESGGNSSDGNKKQISGSGELSVVKGKKGIKSKTKFSKDLLLTVRTRKALSGNSGRRNRGYGNSSGGGETSRDPRTVKEFQAGEPYHMEVIVTNVSPHELDAQILAQIPVGAVPLGKCSYTKAKICGLQSYNCAKMEMDFYFPRAGKFIAAPACCHCVKSVRNANFGGQDESDQSENEDDDGHGSAGSSADKSSAMDVEMVSSSDGPGSDGFDNDNIEFLQVESQFKSGSLNNANKAIVATSGDVITFNVVDDFSDATKKQVLEFSDVLRQGEDAILEFLKKKDLSQFRQSGRGFGRNARENFDFQDILPFAGKSRSFWKRAVDILRKRGVFEGKLWSLGFHYQSVRECKEYLGRMNVAPAVASSNSELAKLGCYFQSGWFSIGTGNGHTLGGSITSWSALQQADGNSGSDLTPQAPAIQGPSIIAPPIAVTEPSSNTASDEFRHLDYRPLINRRAHPLHDRNGEDQENEILNRQLRETYSKFLRVMSRKMGSDKDGECGVRLAYYLICQERIEEAKEVFARSVITSASARNSTGNINRGLEMQRDYMVAYFDLFDGDENNDLQTAKSVVQKWVGVKMVGDTKVFKCPHKEWRKKFQEVAKTLAEIEDGGEFGQNEDETGFQLLGKDANAASFQGATLKEGSSLEVSIERKGSDTTSVCLNTTGLEDVTVKLYRLDLEMLFSRKPFSLGAKSLGKDDSDFSYVNPVFETKVAINKGGGVLGGASSSPNAAIPGAPSSTMWQIPLEHATKDLAIEVCNTQKNLQRFKTHFASDLTVHVAENYGYLIVRKESSTQKKTTTPISVESTITDVGALHLSKQRKLDDGSGARMEVDNAGNNNSTSNRRGLPAVYVKVFAKMTGQPAASFFKDGYTDLRGRFDYASLTGSDATKVEKFAILVMSDKRGGLVRECGAPKVD